MEMLSLREKEIFETLKKLQNYRFVIIGGYAVNAYTLPRFSVDCDIVVENKIKANSIGKELEKEKYILQKVKEDLPYHENFLRYGKTITPNFNVSMDILIEKIFDRQTKAIFSAQWIFQNSEPRLLKGKTITDKIKVGIINPDALIVMKMVSCRSTDIRDVFMLIPQAKDFKWIKEEISKRYNFKDRVKQLISKINSTKFKDNLQGVYGYVEDSLFEKHKQLILKLEKAS